jgi:hypothetical protein
MPSTQVYSFKHPDFLPVSQRMGWRILRCTIKDVDKYQLDQDCRPDFASNTFIVEQRAGSADPKNYQDPEGAFAPRQSIPALQRRGPCSLP